MAGLEVEAQLLLGKVGHTKRPEARRTIPRTGPRENRVALNTDGWV